MPLEAECPGKRPSMPTVPGGRLEPKPELDGEQPRVEDFERFLENKLVHLDEKLDKLTQQVTECLGLLTVKVGPSVTHDFGHSVTHELLPAASRVLPSMGSRPSAQSDAFFLNSATMTSHRRASRASGSESALWHSTTPVNSHRRTSATSEPVLQHSTSPTDAPRRRASRVSRVSLESGHMSINSIATWIKQRRRRQGCLSQSIWNFLEHPDSTVAATIFNRTMPPFILVTVLLSLIHATESTLAGSEAAEYIGIAIETAFALEIGTRFLVCPNRLTFFISTFNLIDVASVMPLAVRVGWQVAGAPRRSRGVRLILDSFVPVLRLLKTLRRFQTLHLLTKAFRLASEAVPVLLYFYLCVWLLFSAIVYAVEDRGNLASFADAMWLTFISMTTVGYGDYSPKSTLGRAVVAVLVLSCTLYMAIPIGIIGSCFSEVWSDRDRILLVQRLRSCFVQNGFTAEDIPEVFAGFDFDKTGTLNLIKFRRMADMLRLGLSEARVLALFQLFDGDGCGGIDDRAFVRTLFPGAYQMLYNSERRRSSLRASASSRLLNHIIAS